MLNFKRFLQKNKNIPYLIDPSPNELIQYFKKVKKIRKYYGIRFMIHENTLYVWPYWDGYHDQVSGELLGIQMRESQRGRILVNLEAKDNSVGLEIFEKRKKHIDMLMNYIKNDLGYGYDETMLTRMFKFYKK